MMRGAVALLVVLGCGKSAPSKPRDAAAEEFQTIDGTTYVIRDVKAVPFGSRLLIALSNKVETCDSATGDGVPLQLDVPSGPGGHYFAGTTIGTRPITVANRNGLPSVEAGDVELTIDPFDPHAGARITGTYAIEGARTKLHGHFDTRLCGDLAPEPQPTTAPPNPVTTFSDGAQQSFLLRTAIATPDALTLYDAPFISCDGIHTGRAGSWMSLAAAMPTRAKPRLGVIQPAWADGGMADRPYPVDDDAWIRFDQVDFDQATLAATIWTKSGAAGTVNAHICP